MIWYNSKQKKPRLIRVAPKTNCAISPYVLGAFFFDGRWQYEVTEYRRGGQGDDCTLYWGGCWGEPKFWTKIDQPTKHNKHVEEPKGGA